MQKQLIVGAMMVFALQGGGPGASDTTVQRGEYLVREVAQCGMCHTPHSNNGQMNEQRWLQGGVLWFRPVHEMPDWALAAPPLAGTGLSDAELLRVLTTGRAHDGSPLRPPMHTYRMSGADAAAIVHYLRSLRRGRASD